MTSQGNRAWPLVGRAALCVGALLVAAGCSTGLGGDEGDTATSGAPSVADADLEAVGEHWRTLTAEERDRVCLQALERSGPDYKGMLRELRNTGLTQPQAAAMLPTVVNKCT